MDFSLKEVFETVNMTIENNFDIRTVTLGINLKDCIDKNVEVFCSNIYNKIVPIASRMVEQAEYLSSHYGIPIINKRIAITPLSLITEFLTEDEIWQIILTLEKVAVDCKIDFIGGIGILAHKSFTKAELKFLKVIERSLIETNHLCSFINIASVHAGINMDGLYEAAKMIKRVAQATENGIGAAKVVVFANAPEDSPFMAGAFHGVGEGECVVNVGISGPGVVKDVVKQNPDIPLSDLADVIKRTVFKITRCGELIGTELAERIGIDFGIVDLSLAPTTKVGDSVAEILEAMGLESIGIPGSTAAVFLLINAVRKGGMMASSRVGGLSGTFIPVSEDIGMVKGIQKGTLNLQKLEALTAVCSVGLDMIFVPGATSAETIAGIIADEMAIGVSNDKTTAVRIIPVPGKKAGDYIDFGGLLGEGPILDVSECSCARFIQRGGMIPPTNMSYRN